jgi:putative SOS response-associated peptidase YedK
LFSPASVLILRTPFHLLMRHFNLSAQQEWQLPLRFNIAPTQEIAVIVATDAGRALGTMRWGLIPSWSKDPKSGPPLFNARSETAAEKPTFRSAMRHRRCLIPADGFYEWKKEGKHKLPIYVRRPDEQPFAFAGLWEQWRDLQSCTILTTAANELMAPLHDRMPVILSPNDYEVWLDRRNDDPEKLEYHFEPVPDDEWIAYSVNSVVNNARNDVADCIEAVATCDLAVMNRHAPLIPVLNPRSP